MVEQHKPWTDEDNRLIQTFEGPIAELAGRLGRTVGSVGSHKSRLRHPAKNQAKSVARRRVKTQAMLAQRQRVVDGFVQQDNNRLPWSLQHQATIIAADRPSDTELARQLGRTVRAIQTKRRELIDPTLDHVHPDMDELTKLAKGRPTTLKQTVRAVPATGRQPGIRTARPKLVAVSRLAVPGPDQTDRSLQRELIEEFSGRVSPNWPCDTVLEVKNAIRRGDYEQADQLVALLEAI